MASNTNISIIQLIRTGDIHIETEISNFKAGNGIHIRVQDYLKSSSDYQEIAKELQQAELELKHAPKHDLPFHQQKLQQLRKVEHDFIVNTCLLANTFATIDTHSQRLKKALKFFEKGKIKEANELLNEADLLDDQINLIAYAKYLEALKMHLQNGIDPDHRNFK